MIKHTLARPTTRRHLVSESGLRMGWTRWDDGLYHNGLYGEGDAGHSVIISVFGACYDCLFLVYIQISSCGIWARLFCMCMFEHHGPPNLTIPLQMQTEMQICLWCLLSTIYRPLLVANRTRGLIECFQNECWSSKPNDPPLLAFFVSFIYLLQSSFSLGVHNSRCFGNDAVNDNWDVYLFIFNTFVIVKEEHLWARWKEILSPYAVKPWLDVQCNPTFLSV